MHNQFANAFYQSPAWRSARKLYAKRCGGLCERCLRRGLIVPGCEVHHKIRLTRDTINNPKISLNPDNLELLCKACHLEEHAARRWRVDADGRVEV